MPQCLGEPWSLDYYFIIFLTSKGHLLHSGSTLVKANASFRSIKKR